uniref:Uncharacterized protein n=1 Tax=Tetraselmis sp. GSL018 TaxID=582737 RepID=A0A061S5E6_9CHLO
MPLYKGSSQRRAMACPSKIARDVVSSKRHIPQDDSSSSPRSRSSLPIETSSSPSDPSMQGSSEPCNSFMYASKSSLSSSSSASEGLNMPST